MEIVLAQSIYVWEISVGLAEGKKLYKEKKMERKRKREEEREREKKEDKEEKCKDLKNLLWRGDY